MPTQVGRGAGVDGHGHWGWCSGLPGPAQSERSGLPGPAQSEGALLEVALRPGGACAGGRSFGLRGAIVHRGQGQWVGKGIAMVVPPLVCYSTMMPCLYGALSFLCKPSQLCSSSIPTADPSLGPLSLPHFPAPSPPPHHQIHNSGWGTQGCSTVHVRRSYSVLPSTGQLLRSPLIL